MNGFGAVARRQAGDIGVVFDEGGDPSEHAAGRPFGSSAGAVVVRHHDRVECGIHLLSTGDGGVGCLARADLTCGDRCGQRRGVVFAERVVGERMDVGSVGHGLTLAHRYW